MKKMGKRIAGALLALVLALALLPGTVQTASAETEGDYEYEVVDGEATVTGYIGAGGDVVIPGAVGGYPVTRIGYTAFSECTSLTSITIPASVTLLGYAAFGGSGLVSVKFLGSAPGYDGGYATPFALVTATAYYPASNDTWTEAARENLGGDLTWVAYEPETEPAEEKPAPAPQTNGDAAAAQPIAYEVLEAQNTAWKADEGGALVIRSSADFSKFVEVRLDGKVLDKANYEVKEGFTIVTVKPEFIGTLGAGEHTLEIVSTDGVAKADFTVTAATQTTGNTPVKQGVTTSPQTGDTVALWMVLAIFSLSGVAVLVVTYRKKCRA